MKIQEILKKALDGGELSSTEQEYAEKYAESDRALKEQLARTEAEKSELQHRIEEMEDAKLSGSERLNKQLKNMSEALETVSRERDSLRDVIAERDFEIVSERLARENHCNDVDYLRYKLKSAAIDPSDSGRISDFLSKMKADSPRFFDATLKSGGTGGTGGNLSPLPSSGGDRHLRYAEIMKKEKPSALELSEAMQIAAELRSAPPEKN